MFRPLTILCAFAALTLAPAAHAGGKAGAKCPGKLAKMAKMAKMAKRAKAPKFNKTKYHKKTCDRATRGAAKEALHYMAKDFAKAVKLGKKPARKADGSCVKFFNEVASNTSDKKLAKQVAGAYCKAKNRRPVLALKAFWSHYPARKAGKKCVGKVAAVAKNWKMAKRAKAPKYNNPKFHQKLCKAAKVGAAKEAMFALLTDFAKAIELGKKKPLPKNASKCAAAVTKFSSNTNVAILGAHQAAAMCKKKGNRGALALRKFFKRFSK